MDKPYLRYSFEPRLEAPILVEGLPGFGNVGTLAAQLLIEFTRAKVFAKLYAPSFPDYVTVENDGICRLPLYEFHAASNHKNQFIILTGDTPPATEDLLANYALCGEILDLAERYGCKFVVTMGGVPTSQPKGAVYIAATSENIVTKGVKKGAIVCGEERITGTTGLLLGLAKKRGIEGVCLLGETTGFTEDRDAARSIYKFLLKILDQE